MKKGDYILIVLLLAACALLFVLSLSGDTSGWASVCVDGQEITRLDLAENTSYTVQNEYGCNIIVVSDGEVSIISADCPDGSCTRFAPISRAGECIVCLPHRLSVTVGSGSSAQVDAVTK